MRRTHLALLAALALPLPVTGAQQPASEPAGLAAAQRALELQDAERALEIVGQHLARSPKDPAALLLRSTARCMLGELDACKRDLDLALRLDPTLRQGWLQRSAIAISEERWDDALAALREAERLDPSAFDNALNQGAVELLRGDLAAASAQFQRHLERQPGAADAWYQVARNYAYSGYAALAVQHLQRAVALDERSRVRARTDANFAELATHRALQQLFASDGFVPPQGSSLAERTLRTRYSGAESPIVVAILNALQLAGARLDSRVEITPDWALLWSEFRIKLLRNADESTTVRLSAPPGTFDAAAWQRKSAAFFSAVESQLLRLELAAEAPTPAEE